MPRYFFNVHDGSETNDKEGVVLAGLHEVRRQAIIVSCQLLKDYGLRFWRGEKWQMYVVDEAGKTVLLLNFSGAFRENDALALLAAERAVD